MHFGFSLYKCVRPLGFFYNNYPNKVYIDALFELLEDSLLNWDRRRKDQN